MKRRAVITGLGAVTPLGVGARSLYERWAAGECGIVDGAGACSEFEPKEVLSVKEVRRLEPDRSGARLPIRRPRGETGKTPAFAIPVASG